MLKGELEILASIALNKCKMKQIINSRIVRNNPYVVATVDSMVKHGFIQSSNLGEYRLTLKGVQALLEFGNTREITSKILHSELFRQYLDTSYTQLKEENSILL